MLSKSSIRYILSNTLTQILKLINSKFMSFGLSSGVDIIAEINVKTNRISQEGKSVKCITILIDKNRKNALNCPTSRMLQNYF